ncbi:MAG: alpha-amylase, partial [Nitrosomonadales bacterium]
ALEQSNTAVYFENRLFLKGYRRLQLGTNLEVEVGCFLTEHSFSHAVPVAGYVELNRADGQKITLALLQSYVENQGIGWNFVLDYLQRFLREHLVELSSQSVESPPPINPHDYFLTLMGVLGCRTAELHLAFCNSVGEIAFEPEPITSDDLAAWSAKTYTEAVATFDKLEILRDSLTDDLRAACDRLLSLRPILLDRISLSNLGSISAYKMRHHGDYHLGQVLLVENDFIITDFEGEPARSMDERRQKHSPLRDVAGMLRSFSYASSVATNQATAERPADRQHFGPLVNFWENEVAGAFLKSYRDTIQGSAVWPVDFGTADRLIDFFVIEKTLYELRYEMDNRPDWLSVPLFSLLRTLQHKRDTEDHKGEAL